MTLRILCLDTSPTVEVGNVSIYDHVFPSVGIQPTPHSSHTVESSTRIEAPLLHLGSDVRNLRSERIKACWNNDFVNTFNQDFGLKDTAIEISAVENLMSKCMENLTPKHTLTFTDNDSEECGHHMARSPMQKLRHPRTMRIRAFWDNIATDGGRHMASPSKRRAHRKKSSLKVLDAQSVRAFKPYAMPKRKRVQTIEDSCNEPHLFRAPQRRVIH